MSIYRDWFLAARPWSFTMSFISVSVGAAVAALHGPFSITLYLLSLVAMIALHGATNVMNDYFDYRSGVDTTQAATANYRPHPLVEGRLSLNHILAESIILYLVGIGLGGYLICNRGWPLLLIGLIGVAASLFYTAPPLQYKYKAWGEFSVFLMWGPLAVEGAYYVQRQSFSTTALLVSVPFGVLVALVLFANNFRDIENDRSKGIKTLGVMLGLANSLRLYIAMILFAYLSVTLMAVYGPLKLWSLLVLLSIPVAVKLIVTMWRSLPDDADAQTAKLDTAFGLLLLISLVLGRIW
ncbi:MAG: 1,4-dihydroxy-2-naphthoate octaprenyltransferase [Deltaproteobacteria bacterium]|nr:1,4-dihydroxy-2-naphthoate octaprenyltransferase [Deltaproteobacteria bacterium]